MDDPLDIKPGEKVIIIGPENIVLYSDYAPVDASNKEIHLLDVIGSKHQIILRLIAEAMNHPGYFAEGNVVFRSEPKRLRVMHQSDYRTHIIFSPPAQEQKVIWKIEKPPH